ncbi:NAD(P)/FAD-dependent oxidoreductase [Virgibacillus litoralis]|uniref:Sarcosine oxidase subunit alpha n=1 Tax=Virgibacillus litoralis TaxID=578221 RepID=A0ABS4HJ79_9BACI|nr:NAD(P)/FAD-dependent oxidoreductase [Virgibacillus litoralis]MBP1950956.1 sarcosine oxidase subunit alpha [Virgibacillus litoralis]
MKYDLIVIGAGPAGMSAAIKAASYGAKVAVIDENPSAGGKLLGQLHKEPKSGWWHGRKIAREMETNLRQTGVTCFQGKEVWGIYPRWKVIMNNGEELQSENVLIASGATEKAIPVPGWTLPGAMAVGAAQTLTNYHRVKPGNKVAVIGVDPLSLSVAHQLKIAGVHVVGIFLPPNNEFSKDRSTPSQMISYLSSMAHAAPNIFLKFAGNMAKYPFVQQVGAKFYPRFGIIIWGTPFYLRKTVLEIGGAEQVEHIKVAPVSQEGIPNEDRVKTVDVDCVCISGGLYPLMELAGAAGCESVYIEELGGHIPLHSPEMETTQPGIFVAGNITGIESAKVAMEQGNLAGTVVAAKLGLFSYKLIEEAQKNVKEARENAVITFQQNIAKGREKSQQSWKEYDSKGVKLYADS